MCLLNIYTYIIIYIYIYIYYTYLYTFFLRSHPFLRPPFPPQAPIRVSTEVTFGKVVCCIVRDPVGHSFNYKQIDSWAPSKPPRGQTLRSPRPRVTSALTRGTRLGAKDCKPDLGDIACLTLLVYYGLMCFVFFAAPKITIMSYSGSTHSSCLKNTCFRQVVLGN